jgi:hypothetical protein
MQHGQDARATAASFRQKIWPHRAALCVAILGIHVAGTLPFPALVHGPKKDKVAEISWLGMVGLISSRRIVSLPYDLSPPFSKILH